MNAQKAKELSVIAQTKNDTTINNILPKIKLYIIEKIKQEANMGYTSYFFNIKNLLENTNFVDFALGLPDSNTFKKYVESTLNPSGVKFLKTNNHKKVFSELYEYFTNLGYKVNNNYPKGELYIRWD